MSLTEEEQERENLLKGLYQPCKKWYNTAKCKPLKSKYGDFPSHWKELGDWAHIKLIQRMYFHITEKLAEGVKQKDLILVDIEQEILDKLSGKHDYEQNGGGVENDGHSTDNKEGEDGEVVKEVKIKVEVGEESNGAAASTTVKAEIDGDGTHVNVTIKADLDSTDSVEDKPLRKKVATRSDSGWETVNSLGLPNIPGLSLPSTILSPEQYHQCTLLRKALTDIDSSYERIAAEAAELDARPDRSPSPPPIYDSEGKRVNTREFRMREALNNKKNGIIEQLIKLNPNYKPPTDYDRNKNKPQRKVYIPVKEFPNYNFIGLIIGPRGSTQREMEKATNCRISVRGKGSVKEGSQGRNTQEVNQAEADDLHVLITGETMEGAMQAEEMVKALLKPLDDQDNAHKMNQLRQLAVINGTLREDDFCAICGEKGHKQYECPHRAKGLQSGVKCKYCGEVSHPSRDCPMRKQEQQSAAVLDSAYSDFMAELDGREAVCHPVTANAPSSSDPASAPPAKKQKVIVMDMLTGLAPSSNTSDQAASNRYGGGSHSAAGSHYGGGVQGTGREAGAQANRRGQAQLPAWMTDGATNTTTAPAPAPAPAPTAAPTGRANVRGQQQLPAWMTEGATTATAKPATDTGGTTVPPVAEQQPVLSLAQQQAAAWNSQQSQTGSATTGLSVAQQQAAYFNQSQGFGGDATVGTGGGTGAGYDGSTGVAGGASAGGYDYNNMTAEQWNEAYAKMTPEQQAWYNYQYQYQLQYAQQYQQYYQGGTGGTSGQ
jgi:splicing factor 1